jgi:plastocyanin
LNPNPATECSPTSFAVAHFAMRLSLTAACALVLLGSGSAPPSEGQNAVFARTGSITGTVNVEQRPTRRRARRYSGGRTKPARPVQQLPMVAYLRGEISGGEASRAPLMAQEDTAFAPGVLAIEVGGSVDFPNRDMFFHNVFSYSKAQRFDLGRYPQGESKSVRFPKAGVVKVYCEVHEFMRAAIIVSENRHHAVVGTDGSFTLSDIPAGTYELVVWHPDLREVVTSVTVPEGGAARVEVTLQ